MSFSRSLSNLKWHDQTMKFNVKQQQNFNKKITPFINAFGIQRPQILKNTQNSQHLKLSKHISKLYDCYPVTQVDKSESSEMLPFIPSEVFLKPLRLDPRFNNIYNPKPRFGSNINNTVLPVINEPKHKKKIVIVLKREVYKNNNIIYIYIFRI